MPHNRNKLAQLEIAVGGKRTGTLTLELYHESVPKTVENFVHQIQSQHYQNCPFHRIIPNFMAQGGDYVSGDGTGGESLYGPAFPDENFVHSHSRRGCLSMANAGPDTNGSQFFITFRPTPHLNGKHVVFGHVVMNHDGQAVLEQLESVPTGRDHVPNVPVMISSCRVLGNHANNEAEEDDNEIELDEEQQQQQQQQQEQQQEPVAQEEPEPTGNSLQDRLRRLKMKMNQARQLNRRQVLQEGERIGTLEAQSKERVRQAKEDQKRDALAWQAQHSKALQLAQATGTDVKALTQSAEASLAKARQQEETRARNRASVNDHYNPEGQHRHYERNLKALPRDLERSQVTDTYNPILQQSNNSQDEKEGARRLAKELHRRIEKQKKKRDRVEFEAEDVTFIDKRNKMFNKKLARTYDKATAEIRQNLERGTAL